VARPSRGRVAPATGSRAFRAPHSNARNAIRKTTGRLIVSTFDSRSSGRLGIKGYATNGRPVAVIFEPIDELTVMVVTAFYITRES
jgi:hypothetical protein